MKIKLSIIFSICSLLLLMGCSDSALNSDAGDLQSLESETLQKPNSEEEFSAPAPDNQTIAEIVINSATADKDKEFTLLLAALKYADLAGVFAGEGQYTVFAPTDEAFGNLVDTVKPLLDEDVLKKDGPFAAIDDRLGEGTVEDVLLYHVTNGRRAANSVVPNHPRAKDRKISTLLKGATFSVSSGSEITAVGNSAKIIDTDISASNGIIHVLDTVILPIKL